MSEIQPIDETKLDIAHVIDSRIWNRFMLDFGTVQAVNSDKRHVDVQHAVQPVSVDGTVKSAFVTKNVEVLFVASSDLSIPTVPKKGDLVLLLGLKDYVQDTSGALPINPTEFRHYSRDTLKAVYLGPINPNSSVSLSVDSSGNLLIQIVGAGKATIKNATVSLETVLENHFNNIGTLLTALTTFATGLNSGTLVAQAAALVTAITPIVASINTDVVQLKLILKA